MSQSKRVLLVLCAAALCGTAAAAQDFVATSFPVIPSVSSSLVQPMIQPLVPTQPRLTRLLQEAPAAAPVALGEFRSRIDGGCFAAACARFTSFQAAPEWVSLLQRDRTHFHDLTVIEIAQLGPFVELEGFRSRARSGWLDGSGLFAGSRAARGALRTLSPAPRRSTAFGLRLDFHFSRD
jgi:hypothetical protein